MNKSTTKERNSTVAISPDVAKKLDRFCRDKNMTKKDFISLSLAYFEKFGINPAVHESPSDEIEKLRKRFDQLIAFIRTQEKDKINPMFEAIATSEARIKSDLDTIVKNENLQSLNDTLNKVFGSITQNTRRSDEMNHANAKGLHIEIKKISDSLVLISEAIESGKDRKGLAGAIKNILGV